MESEGEHEISSSFAITSKSMAVLACAAMTLLYVAVLYVPTLILRLPPPASYKHFMIRRFLCAAVSSILSLLISSVLLPHQTWKISYILACYGIRVDHIWAALVFPFLLTSLMYMGSLVKSILVLDSWNGDGFKIISVNCIMNAFQSFMTSLASDVTVWRNLVVAPITEELVFRACMIPLLLCGGFKSQTIVLVCPVLFSLAHLNHLLDFYIRKNYSLLKTSVAVGTQLAYTMVFGSYASFLFIRTGHLIAPLVAHIVCNFMGLPTIYFRKRGILVSLAFMVGSIGFLWLIFPLTDPALYNSTTDNCFCWHGFCSST